MMTQNKKLECIELNPKIAPIGSVIWLHGLGADGNDFVPIVPELQLSNELPLRFIFPNAPEMPVTINNGYVMRAWYDIVSLSINQRSDETGILKSVSLINDLIENEEKRGVPANKIVLAGFSQGAVIALTAGLSFQKQLAGIIALSGYFPHADKVLANVVTENKSIPIFLAHGVQDPVVPFMLGTMARDLLEQHHYNVSWHQYAMPHSVCGEEIVDIGMWLRGVFG